MAVVVRDAGTVATDHVVEDDRSKQQPRMSHVEDRQASVGVTNATFEPFGERESASAFGLRTAGEILKRYLASVDTDYPRAILSGIERLHSQAGAVRGLPSTSVMKTLVATSLSTVSSPDDDELHRAEMSAVLGKRRLSSGNDAGLWGP